MSPAVGGFFAGSIVSKLTLDKTGWNKSVKSVGQDEKKVKGMTGKMSANFKKVGAGMTVAGAAIVASFGKMISSFVKTGDELDKMSKRTGFSTTALSELKHAANITGADISGLEKGIKKMAKAIVDGEAGMTTYTRAFDLLNLETADLLALSPEEQFLKIGDAISKLESPTQQTAMAMDIFGRAGTTLIPLFAEGAEGMAELRAEAHDLGIVFDTEAATAAAKLKDEQTRLKGAMQGLGMQLAQVIVPILSDLATKITKVVSGIGKWMKEHPGLISLITKLAGGLGLVMTILGPMVMIFPKIVAGFKAIKIAVIALSGPVGLVVAGLSALTLGFLKVKGAQDKANKSAETYRETNRKLLLKLKGMADEAGLTAEEFSNLTIKYKGNSAALGMAIHKGKEGVELQQAMQKNVKEHTEEQAKLNVEIEDTASIIDKDLIPAIDEATKAEEEAIKATEEYMGILHDLGVVTASETKEEIDDLKGSVALLELMFQAGEVDAKTYAKTMHALGIKINTLEGAYDAVLPPARDFGAEVLKHADIAPVLKTEFFEPIKAETKAVGSVWTDVSQRIKDQWTTKLSEMLEGSTSLKDGLQSIWGTVKSQFFTLVSQMATKFTLGFISKIASGGSGLLDTFKGIFGGIGKAATGAASGSGAGGLIGNMGGTFLSTLGSIAGPLGIGLLAAKFLDLEGIGKAVSDTIISGFTAWAGLVSDIAAGIGAIAKGIGQGIGKLFGGGAKKGQYAEITFWLEPMRWDIKEIRDYIFINFRETLRDWTVKFNQRHDDIMNKFNSLQILGQNRNSILRDIRDNIGKISKNSEEEKKEKKYKKKGQKGHVVIPGTLIIPSLPGIDTTTIGQPGGGEDVGGGLPGPKRRGEDIGIGEFGGGRGLDGPLPPGPDIPSIPDVPGGNIVRKKVFIFRIGNIEINIPTDNITDDPRKFVRDKLMPEFMDALESKIGLKRLQQSVLGG